MSKKVAYGGILLAINIIILLLINVLPINTLFLMGLASLPIAIVIMEYGPRSGVAFYIACIILGFIVMTSKIQWILYVFTFGIYGLIKYIIEQDRPIYLEYVLKILFANIAVVIVYFILRAFVYIPVNSITVGLFQVAFIVYDYVYTSFIDYYNTKIKQIINKI
ncbi:hypothetical protein [Romboutsia sp.]|uniref:hypothetical protein n=1 Tax=Romboutsia sp. TaxID=1965302 RepID=UPI003F3FA915